MTLNNNLPNMSTIIPILDSPSANMLTPFELLCVLAPINLEVNPYSRGCADFAIDWATRILNASEARKNNAK